MKTRDDYPYRPCVGVMILNTERKVWVGERKSTFTGNLPDVNEKRWQMPQGGIDKGEEPLAAARRELWEETGISNAELLAEAPNWYSYDLPDEMLGIALKGKWRGQRQRWFAFLFVGNDSQINISHPPDGAPVEFTDWKWVDMEVVPELIVDFKREIYQQVVGAFRHLRHPS